MADFSISGVGISGSTNTVLFMVSCSVRLYISSAVQTETNK